MHMLFISLKYTFTIFTNNAKVLSLSVIIICTPTSNVCVYHSSAHRVSIFFVHLMDKKYLDLGPSNAIKYYRFLIMIKVKQLFMCFKIHLFFLFLFPFFSLAYRFYQFLGTLYIFGTVAIVRDIS